MSKPASRVQGVEIDARPGNRPARWTVWAGLAGYLMLLLCGIGLFLLIRTVGEGLSAPVPTDDVRRVGRAMPGQVNVVLHVTATLSAVIGLGFVLGRVFRFFGQPPVIGEVVAGILLGPSLLGAISPAASHLLIPSAASDPKGQVPAALVAVSQLGVILYMFLVGLELNGARLAGRAHAAVAVSHSSIVVPFVLGAALALGLYPVFSNAEVPFTSFSLFMGAAMAITAFPVLARILTDRGLDKTELGSVALSCAAADDVTAWCLLALVVGVAQANVSTAASVLGWATAFIALMFLAVGPLLRRVTRIWDNRPNGLPPLAVSGTFLAVLLAALTTEAIGIHAVFGAFLLGAVIPHDSQIAREFTTKLKDTVTVLLLPAFFAYTGMRTQINLVSGWENWLWCGAIVLVATIGKFGGTLAAARLTGLSWRDAAALGTLMNTRGLMELIILNIGLDLGVISPTLFAMMVVMALVTTAATAPILQRLIPGASPAP
ncbi:MAG TPA: cation:proton antiporter [Pirellulales bacterium]|jgi:Kef-type K+ transport system membrane component KefB|nr:cation:proton antiporter [Pirellulales bacterium]